MIIEYLEKMHQEMYEKKVSIERTYQKSELLLKENMRFIHTLEDSLDRNYESFSPHDINHENYEKIKKLKEEQVSISEECETLKDKISDINTHLAEIESVLKVSKQDKLEMDNQEIEHQKIEKEKGRKEVKDTVTKNYYNLIHKIKFCIELIDVDSPRCKLELQSIKQIIEKYIENM